LEQHQEQQQQIGTLASVGIREVTTKEVLFLRKYLFLRSIILTKYYSYESIYSYEGERMLEIGYWHKTTGENLYAVVAKADDVMFWDVTTSIFSEFSLLANHAVVLVEDDLKYYAENIDSNFADSGVYVILVFLQAGGSPSINDRLLTSRGVSYSAEQNKELSLLDLYNKIDSSVINIGDTVNNIRGSMMQRTIAPRSL